MNIRKCLCLTFVVLFTVSQCNSAKILAAFVFPGRSHFMMHKVLINELLNRGHEITLITSLPIGQNLGENYTELLIPPMDYWTEIQDDLQFKTIFDLASMTLMDFIKMVRVLGIKTTEFALQQPKVQKILHRNDTRNVYDLLIVEEFYQEAFLTLALKYDIPIVASSTLTHQNYMSQMMGVITPWSFVPHGYLTLDEKMNFWERAKNTIASLYDDLYRHYIYVPEQDALVKKYFSHLPMKLPLVSEMKKNASVLLLNSYAPLTSVRPYTLGMIDVGGMHIYPPKPLPANIKAFLDGATEGAIYFSLGTQVKSAELPIEKMKIFLDMFSKMKQRVLWKFEDDSLPALPENVMIQKWMPQTDILAHPNVKVFITHGGTFGFMEGIHFGVPMLGMPFYCDQHLNMKKATKAGYALTLNFYDITKEKLENSLKELWENPSYKNKMQQVSKIFRDRPVSAQETAMYWIEYVIRHKGARHIRSAGLDLTWYEFYLLDVIGFFVLGILAAIGAFILVIKKLSSSKQIKQKIN